MFTRSAPSTEANQKSIDDSDPSISYDGSWTSNSSLIRWENHPFFNSTGHSPTSQGAVAKIKFRGTFITIIGVHEADVDIEKDVEYTINGKPPDPDSITTPNDLNALPADQYKLYQLTIRNLSADGFQFLKITFGGQAVSIFWLDQFEIEGPTPETTRLSSWGVPTTTPQPAMNPETDTETATPTIPAGGMLPPQNQSNSVVPMPMTTSSQPSSETAKPTTSATPPNRALAAHHLNKGAIAGGVVGGVFFLFLFALLVFWWHRRKPKIVFQRPASRELLHSISRASFLSRTPTPLPPTVSVSETVEFDPTRMVKTGSTFDKYTRPGSRPVDSKSLYPFPRSPSLRSFNGHMTDESTTRGRPSVESQLHAI